MLSLRIIIPAYNEASRIEPTIADYCSHFEGSAVITVIANGCTDKTVGVVAELQQRYPNLECVEVPFAIGKGGAVRLGLKLGIEELIGYTDADGSTPALSFASLVNHLESTRDDGAIGSRWLKLSKIDLAQPTFRRIASRIFNLFVRSMFGLVFSDTQCGAKVFRRHSIQPLLSKLELSNFAFDVDILYGLLKADRKIREIPIRWINHESGSKVRVFATALTMFVGLLRLRLRTGAFRHLPFIDRLARTTVIPCKSSFSAIIVQRHHPSEDVADKKLAQWIRAATDAGHAVILKRIGSGFIGDLRIAFWYFSKANSVFDVIIEADPTLPSWFRIVSTKMIIGPEILLQENVRLVFAELSSLTDYSAYFYHDEENRWHLSGGSPASLISLDQ